MERRDFLLRTVSVGGATTLATAAVQGEGGDYVAVPQAQCKHCWFVQSFRAEESGEVVVMEEGHREDCPLAHRNGKEMRVRLATFRT